MKVHKEEKLNEIMSLKLEGKKTVLYIKDTPFRQCMRLLVNIPVDEMRDLDNIESIDDLSELFENTDYYKATDITPEDEFKGHHSNLQVWIEHEYDTRLLHSNLAFPILKELAKQGVTKAKTRFKEEVTKRFLSGNFKVITYLIEQQYLSDFTEEELDILFDEYDFSQILKLEIKDRYSWLRKLLNLNTKQSKAFFKTHVITLIREEDWEPFLYIVNSSYSNAQLHIFNEEELEEIFKEFNYSSFLENRNDSKYHFRRKLKYLERITQLGVSSAKRLLRKEIKETFTRGTANEISSIFKDNYLQFFTKEEIDGLIKDINLNTILSSNASYLILSILHSISRYNEPLVKKYMREQMENMFSVGSQYTIKEILDKRHLEIFSEKEQESIAKKINIINLRKAGLHTTLSLLRRIKNLIPSIYKAEFELNFLKGDVNILDSFFRGKYFNDFTKEELTELFEKFDFKKIELGLFKKFLELGVPGVARKFKEARGHSSKLVNLKKEIISKFENGDYKSLHEMFYTYEYSDGYKDERLDDLISMDFEEIFKVVGKSEKFKRNFESSLQQKDPPFSIPFKVLFSNIENTKSSVKELFKEQASRIFASGRQLNIIAFLSRPEYAQIFTEEEFQKIFTFKNEHLKSTIIKALEEDSAAPLPLVVLKRLTDNGEKESQEYLQKQLLQLITTGNTSVLRFLNRDGFISYLKDLTIEMQLFLALSPNLNYLALKHLESPKIEELIDEDSRVEFNRIIKNIQDKDRGYLRGEDSELLREILTRFGIDALKGLIALYSRHSLAMQLITVECILEIYHHHKSKVKADIKQRLYTFFNREFKPFIKYKYTNKKEGVEEFKNILAKFKTEYEELKNIR